MLGTMPCAPVAPDGCRHLFHGVIQQHTQHPVRNHVPLSSIICSATIRAAVGIDLGTTNSVVAVLREGEARPSVIYDTTSGSSSSFGSSSSGSFTIPSVVAYNAATGAATVGAAAKQQAAINPANTFYSVKRLMGRKYEEVQDLGMVYQLDQAADGAVRLVCPTKSAQLTPEEASAELLRHLLQLASQHLAGHTPQQVVITVPAYFNQQQRAATLTAARLAGIQQVSLLQEPVAAAIAFGFGKPYDAETLLVFDLGGGTFDLSVVESFEGILEVLATGGNPFLGGDDFDQALLQWLLQHRQQQGLGALDAAAAAGGGGSEAQQHNGSTCSSGSGSGSSERGRAALAPEQLVQLLAGVEAAKCQLSQQESVQVAVPGSPVAAAAGSAGGTQQADAQDQHQQQHQHQHQHQCQQQHEQPQQQQQWEPKHIQLTRQQMHAATAKLRQQLWQPLQPLADNCKLEYACPPSEIEEHLHQQQQPQQSSSNGTNTTLAIAAPAAAADPYAPKPRQLTAVLLVGGATRMPIIQQGLKVLTGLEPRCEVDPEQAVALGAAIQAAVLMGLSSGVEIMDGSYVEEFHNRSTGF